MSIPWNLGLTNPSNGTYPASPNVRTKRQVSPSRTRLVLLVAFGLSASLWWTWIVGQAAYRIYLVSGSPTHPSRALVWWSVFLPSLLLGLAAGIGVTLLLRASPFKGWVLFWGSLLIGAVVLLEFRRVPTWRLRFRVSEIGYSGRGR